MNRRKLAGKSFDFLPASSDCYRSMKKKAASDKVLDLIDLGLRDVYSSCYSFGFALICLSFGVALSCASPCYENGAAHFAFLLVGLFVSVLGAALVVLGFLYLKKERKSKDGAILRCPIQDKKILRNGYLVGGFLLAIGWATLVLGTLQFPARPIHGVAFLAGSFVVLLYGVLLIVSTIRDHLIAKKVGNLSKASD